MKVSILIPYYGDRSSQLRRSLHFLKRQTYSDYELVVINDGSPMPDDLIDDFDVYSRIRADGSSIRSSNRAYREAFSQSSGDFIIVSHPELLIPYDGVERMVAEANMDRRNGPTQYHLTYEMVYQLFHARVGEWEHDFDEIKSLPGFMSTITPWQYVNHVSHTYRNHFSFSGLTRERFTRYLIPDTEEWGREDAWTHEQEMKNGELSVPIDIEIYHQEHERVWGTITEYSVRVQRIMDSRLAG